MSDQPPPPPPPPPPPGFWQQPSKQQTYPAANYSNQASYGQHPPPPPPMKASLVPPPLYGYNPGSFPTPTTHHGETSSQYHPPDAKRRRVINDSLWKCDACKVYLESQDALRAHTESHITCSQCTFTASKKVVNGHYASKHGKFSKGGFKAVTIAIPGCRVQRFNICVGNHPDDVKKWIQDRKRKFPRQQQKQEPEKKTEESALGSLLDGYGSSSSEDDNLEDKSVANKESERTETTSANAKEKNELSSRQDTARPPNYRTRPCKYFMRNGTCRNGDACNFSHEIQPHQRNNNNNNNNKSKNRTKKPKSSSSTTLLRKLLENDAKREATLSLQLLEYLVDCNYLQKQRKGGDA